MKSLVASATACALPGAVHRVRRWRRPGLVLLDGEDGVVVGPLRDEPTVADSVDWCVVVDDDTVGVVAGEGALATDDLDPAEPAARLEVGARRQRPGEVDPAATEMGRRWRR